MTDQKDLISLRGLSIFLIGMMGTGKTTVGQILAQQLGYRFFDTDILIERVSQKTIKEVFETQGENFFRELESKILTEVATCIKSVIATGGGIVIRPENWCYLRDGLVIWLDAPIDLLVERLKDDQSRPLKDQLESLLEQRRSLYAEADLHIFITEQQTPEDIVTDILTKIPTVLRKSLEK